jgi:hypothetical protein
MMPAVTLVATATTRAKVASSKGHTLGSVRPALQRLGGLPQAGLSREHLKGGLISHLWEVCMYRSTSPD